MLSTGTGSTGETFTWLCSFLRIVAPPIYIGENVDSDFGPDSKNYTELVNRLAAIGYVLSSCILNAIQFGCPQRRVRLYIVALHCATWKLEEHEALQICKKITALAQRLADKDTIPDLSDYLFHATDTYILEQLQSHNDTMLKNDRAVTKDKWPEEHAKVCENYGVSYSKCVAPVSQQASPWYTTLTPREKMLLGLNCIKYPKDDQGIQDLYSVDVQQSMNREPRGYGSYTSTWLPHSRIWLLANQSLLTGAEQFAAQGWPKKMMTPKVLREHDLSDRLLRDMAGNAFAGHCFAAVLLAVFACIPDPAVVDVQASESEDLLDELVHFAD